MYEGRLPPAHSLERTPPAPPRSDGVLFVAAGFVFVVIVALVGWAIWLRIPAGKGAVVAETTTVPAPTAAVAEPATPVQAEVEFVGPIQPPPGEKPRTAASAKPVAVAAPPRSSALLNRSHRLSNPRQWSRRGQRRPGTAERQR